MRRNCVFLIFLFVLMLLIYCNDVTGPTDSNEIQFYDYEIEYRRPVNSIIDINALDPERVYLIVRHGNSMKNFDPKLARQNDYLFTGRMVRIPGNSNIEMNVLDHKRQKETFGSILTWGNPHTVGDIFILKSEQTGIEKELLKIVKNNQFSDLPPNFDAFMAQFTVKKDGSIIDQ